jgi:hypothetical protein
MELVENTLENGSYIIYLPRHYYIQKKFLHGNTGTRYYLCTSEDNNEDIQGILYFGTDQNEHKIRFNQNTIIENIEKIVLDEKRVWPIYFTEENYFTVIIIEYQIGALHRLIRMEGKEKSKNNLKNLINIFTTLRENDNIKK